MGKAYSMLIRPARTFNIENRAERIISREKPAPAPQYKYVEKQRQLADEVNPDFLKSHYEKNAQLNQRLRDVFVTSMGPQETTKSPKDTKPLPQERFRGNTDIIVLNYEPVVIPVGSCSLKQVITFLEQHHQDPIRYSVEGIAVEYKMDKKVIDDILNNFKLLVTQTIELEFEPPEDNFPINIDLHDTFKKEKEKKTIPDKKK